MIGFDVRGKKGLAICEKPSIVKAIGEVYKKHKKDIPYELDFVAQRGHLLRLLNPDEANEDYKTWSWDNLPITEQSLNGWQYVVIQEKVSAKDKKKDEARKFLTSQERFDNIKKHLNSGNYDFVLHIGDPDREGQLLIDIVLEKLGNKLPVMRYWQNALTEEKILPTLQHLRSNDEDFFQNTLKAGKARQHADYLVGMNGSRATSIKMTSRVPVGRVKTTLLATICRRELDILNFKPETVYGVEANYIIGFSGKLFNQADANETSEVDVEDDKEQSTGLVWFKTKQEAEEFISNTSKEGVVTQKTEKQVQTYANNFFKLSTLQSEAEKRFGYNTDKTKDIAQSLYEAGLLTYPRSTCEYLDSTETLDVYLKSLVTIPRLIPFLKEVNPQAIQRVKSTKKWINDKAVSNSGHSAIVPTSKKANIDTLTEEQKNIYILVAERYLAAFLPALIQNKVDLVVAIDNDKTFTSKGKTLVSKGWTELYQRNINDIELPDVKEGDVIIVKDFGIPTKTTQCPKRYTSGTLTDWCENPTKDLDDKSLKSKLKNLKIGTPATLSEAIKTLIFVDKQVALKKEGKNEVLCPTEAGMTIYKNLSAINFSLLEVDTTGSWEIALEEIIEGTRSFEDFEKEIQAFVNSMILEIKNSNMTAVASNFSKEVIGKCTKCGGNIIQTDKSFYCSGYKENQCMSGGFRNVGGHLITKEEFKQLQQGEELVFDAVFQKKGSKRKQKYKQRIHLNENGTIETVKNHFVVMEAPCPACGKRLFEGDNAYICEGVKDKTCQFYLNKITSDVVLQQEDIDLIIKGEDTRKIKNLVYYDKDGKKKSTYNAVLYLDKAEKRIKQKKPMAQSNYVCPVCMKPLMKTDNKYICSGFEDHSCEFEMYSSMYQKEIPDEKLRKMLEQVRSGAISGGSKALISKEIVPTNFSCPYCSTAMKRKDTQIFCENCKFAFYRDFGDELMSDEDIENLLTAGKTNVRTGLLSKTNEPYSAIKVLDYDSKKISLKYIQEEVTTSYNCPICQSKMAQTGAMMNCSNQACGFKLWTIPGQVRMTKKEIDDFFTKHMTEERVMKKKDGGSFTARVAVDFEKRESRFVFNKT